MGLLIPGFTLSWTIAKEANPPQYSGIATSVVNTGIFLGAGILQPLVGWVLDRGTLAGDIRRRLGSRSAGAVGCCRDCARGDRGAHGSGDLAERDSRSIPPTVAWRAARRRFSTQARQLRHSLL